MASGLWPSLHMAGLAAARPAQPSEAPANTFILYFATDTLALSLWNPATNTWSGVQTSTPVTAVAAAGTNYASGGQLVAGMNLVSGSDGTKAVALPATPAVGTIVEAKNNSASAMLVFPDGAATINAIASHGDLSCAAETTVTFIATSPTQWYSFPLVPS